MPSSLCLSFFWVLILPSLLHPLPGLGSFSPPPPPPFPPGDSILWASLSSVCLSHSFYNKEKKGMSEPGPQHSIMHSFLPTDTSVLNSDGLQP